MIVNVSFLYCIAMFIQRTYRKGDNGKIYKSVALMQNYREGKKVKHRIITMLTKWPDNLIEGLDKILKGHKINTVEDLELSNGKSFGALQTVIEVAKRLGISKALGTGKRSKLAMLQIAGRVITQGSRNYIANEWSKTQAIEELLKLTDFNEDSLYDNLDWLAKNQSKIEKKIFDFRYKDKKAKDIFLYDVTSSYFEGKQNELAKYGYNRDKKKGKKQIVVGLMLDSEGYPLTIEVFEGNTSDTKTVSSQLKKLKENFGVERVIFVGDKGMIKSGQIEELGSDEYKWNYLTTITKRQIETLLKSGLLQLSMFDDDLFELESDGIRYIMRKNKYIAEQIERNRQERIEKLQDLIQNQNKYLKEHKKAKQEVARRKIDKKAEKFKLSTIIEITESDRNFELGINEEQYAEKSKLDGCYVVKTDVSKNILDKETAHSRYKDLSKVEFAFRTMKTTIEEIRPIYVRKESKTRGHVFVAMLAYMIVKYITDAISDLNYTRKHAIGILDRIQYVNYTFEDHPINIKPKNLTSEQSDILSALNIIL